MAKLGEGHFLFCCIQLTAHQPALHGDSRGGGAKYIGSDARPTESHNLQVWPHLQHKVHGAVLDVEGVIGEIELAGECGGEDAGDGDLVLVAGVEVVVVHVLDRAGRVVAVLRDVHEGLFVVL